MGELEAMPDDLRARSDAAQSSGPEPVAVVGIGCRFPGGARDLYSLGKLLVAGTDVIREVPDDRWTQGVLTPQRAGTGGTPRRQIGAFLDEIDRFDAAYFGIAPREAGSLDPQQRILLEVAWEAMSDSGRTRESWRGTRTAVFLGMLANDYAVLHAKTLGPDGIGPHYASGVEFSFAAGRLAYTFDLHGPVATINSACSSSLVALHLAIQSLRAGECDTALVGGVNLLISPELSIFMDRIGAISPTGKCRPFDIAADGVVRGEGCGFVVLRRLPEALADGDRVYATVLGSAVNHDGFSMGLTVPNAGAQGGALRSAIANAGLRPMDLDYVEAHGTGTPLGDQIELKTLAEIYGIDRPRDRPLLVGSHKAILGHTDAAAGMAGLLKAIWVVNKRLAPPQHHLSELIPAVDWSRAGIAVPTAGVDIGRADRPIRAGVSAFGLSGTNAHVIVTGPPTTEAGQRMPAAGPDQTTRPARSGRPHVLIMSSPHQEGLTDQAAQMRTLVARAVEHGDESLADLLTSAATRRTHEAHRCVLVADDPSTMLSELDKIAGSPGGAYRGAVDPDQVPEPVLVYSGQGSQWPGMAVDLYEDVRTIRETLDECDALLRQHVSWSLMDELRRTEDSRLADTDVAQPAIFAVQVALSRWLLECGLRPAAVVGHSLGEIAAAHVAGCLSLSDAVRLTAQRGLILHETAGAGRMVAVEASQETVREMLAESGSSVVIAAVNGPTSTVLAGRTDDIFAATRALTGRGLRCVPLNVNYAFHSPLVAGCGPRLRAAVSHLPLTSPTIKLLSSVHPDAELVCADAAYWEHNLLRPVLLWPAVDRLLSAGPAALIEVGPHPVLGRSLVDAARHRDRHGPVVSMMRRGEPGRLSIHWALARLHVAGVGIDWQRLTGMPRQYRNLPVPSWRGDRYWLPGVSRGQQSATPAIPAQARISLLDAAGQVLGEMIAQPAAAHDHASGPTAQQPHFVERLEEPEAAPGTASPPTRNTSASVISRVETAVRQVLGLGPAQPIPQRRGLFELGLDSPTAVELHALLESEFNTRLASTVVFEHPTVGELAAHLADRTAGAHRDAATSPQGAVTAVASVGPTIAANGQATGSSPAAEEGIAVIGMSCRLPGADSPEQFWSLLCEGRAAIRAIPPERRQDQAWAEVTPDVPDKGGFLDNVADFDASFFRISPREARSMDPQQRLFLEVAWEALEDAGLPAQQTYGHPVGVYLGLNTADYQQLLTRNLSNVDLYYGTGTSFAAAAGRLSYFLGLRGPSIAVDTACSGSLTSVHLACQGLRTGDCDVAVVGGVNVIVAPTVSASMSAGGALAQDGHCKVFDEAADGYGRGEGAAVLILKRLEAAERDRDRIYAVIRASAVNQDGASGGLTVPSATAQTAVIRKALAQARWRPSDVDYVETHGTGTPLGDPIEVQALADALGPGRDKQTSLLIGSVKANVGHLEAGAGVTSLLKVVLALHRGEIPPHLVTTPSSRIDWARLPVALADTHRGWPSRPTWRAGVSAFGFSGSNAHVLVERPASPADVEPIRSGVPYVLVVTAASAAALPAVAARMASRLTTAAPDEVDAIVHTAVHRRHWLDYRLAVTGNDAVELAEALEAAANGHRHPCARHGHVPSGEPRTVAFWFGDQQPPAELSARLASAPAYQEALTECADELAAFTDSRVELLAPPQPELRDAHVFSHHVAATKAWSAAGIAPDVVIGEGVGEISAAWAAGQLVLSEALQLLVDHAAAPVLRPPRARVISASHGERPVGDVHELRARAQKHPEPERAPSDWHERMQQHSTASTAAEFDVAVEVTTQELAEPINPRRAQPANDQPRGKDPLHRIALAAAELFVAGRAPTPRSQASSGHRPVTLPPYPWERRRHWYTDVPPVVETAVEADDAAAQGDDRLFRIEWDRVDAPIDHASSPAAWAVLGRSDLAEDLVAALAKRGHTVVRLDGDDGDDGDRESAWHRRLEALAAEYPNCQGIVLVADPNVPHAKTTPATATPPPLDLLDGLTLAKAMAALPRPVGRLWFVTQRAHDPSGGGDVQPSSSAVWELGRVLAVELSGRWGGLIDVVGDAEAAARALHSTDLDDQLCVRGAAWYAARLATAQPPTRSRDGVDVDRWHVVLGGGAAAQPAVSALVSCGARRLLLVGDVPVPPAAADQATDLTYERCTDEELDARLAALGHVGDVIAVAAPARTLRLTECTLSDIWDRFAGAAAVVRTCHIALQHRPQRLTVMTSAAPSWGSVNTAATAGAVGWLAGWTRRTAARTPASLLGLMPRTDTRELDSGHQPLFEESGLRLLSAHDTQDAVRGAILNNPDEWSVAAVDLRRYVRLCQDFAPRTFLARFEDLGRATGTENLDRLLAAPRAVRDDLLIGLVAEAVADALGLNAAELDPENGFFDLGMDSVMALSVRSRLEDDLGLELSSTLTFEYPTTLRLAEHLAELLGEPDRTQKDQASPEPTAQPATPAPLPGNADGERESKGTEADEALEALEAAIAAAEGDLGGSEDMRTRGQQDRTR